MKNGNIIILYTKGYDVEEQISSWTSEEYHHNVPYLNILKAVEDGWKIIRIERDTDFDLDEIKWTLERNTISKASS